MIRSCSECTTKCCRVGSGPYRVVTVDEWLNHKDVGTNRYNTMCEHYDPDKGLCKIWNNAPIACKVFVCGIRSYSKQELKRIDAIWKQYNWRNK